MRKLKKDWITSYIECIGPSTNSPESFHWWSAATVLAASLKRNVWVDRGNFKLFPNLYTVLVGRPATGKGASIDPAIDIINEANTANVLADRLTIEYVLEKLSKGFPVTTVQGGALQVGIDSSAVVFAPELSVFLRNSSDALSDLTQLWDNRESFDYGTRHKGLYTITKPCLSVLGGSTARWLAKSIPNDAVGGGFTRRVNFVYTKNDPHMPSWNFSKNGTRPHGRDELVNDLRHITSHLKGEFKATPGFINAFDTYTKNIKFESFEDEATVAFKASKWTNATKLSMILSVARSDDMTLIEQDWLTAAQCVDKVEEDLGLVFRSVGESDDAAAAARILEYVELRGVTTFPDIMRALWRHVSRDDAQRLLTSFVEMDYIRETSKQHHVLYTFNMSSPKGGP